MRTHPWLTLSTVATAVAILSAAIPGIWWVAAQIQTTGAAKDEAMRNAKRDAWAAYSIARLESVMLRNRVNECDERTAARRLSPVETASCEQYRREFADASRRATDLQKEAMALGKDR